MTQILIIGGGLSGLLTARICKQKGIPFLGLEKEDVLGGRLAVGHHRFYHEPATQFLSELTGDLQWDAINDEAMSFTKGEWRRFDGDIDDSEEFFVRHPFYSPLRSYGKILESLVGELKENFQTQKNVVAIQPKDKKVICQDGSEIPYEKLVWCCPLNTLLHTWKGDKLPLQKLMKKSPDPVGGLNLELELKESIFPTRNTVVFPFRFKEHKLKALGTNETQEEKLVLNWRLFLPSEISEDREEVAKCVRALRRELEKEFTTLRAAIVSERIVYLQSVSNEQPALAGTMEVLPDTLYLGPEIVLTEEDGPLRNLDLTLTNARHLVRALSAPPPNA